MGKNVLQYSCIKRILFIIAVGLCLIGAGTAAKAGPLAYFQSNALNGTFGTIDLSTGATTIINSANGLGSIVGLGVYNGQLYAADNNGASGHLYSINTTTGVGTLIGTSGIAYGTFGSTRSGLFAYSGGYQLASSLASINPHTGAATAVGTTIQGALFPVFSTSSDSSSLYKFDVNTSGDHRLLASINTADGTTISSTTDLHADGFRAMLETNGTLYAILEQDAGGPFGMYTINPTNGATSLYGSYTQPGTILGLAPYPLISPVSHDFNGDGKPDILWRNTTTGANAVWYMDGVTLLGVADLPALPNGAYALVGTGISTETGSPTFSGGTRRRARMRSGTWTGS